MIKYTSGICARDIKIAVSIIITLRVLRVLYSPLISICPIPWDSLADAPADINAEIIPIATVAGWKMLTDDKALLPQKLPTTKPSTVIRSNVWV